MRNIADWIITGETLGSFSQLNGDIRDVFRENGIVQFKGACTNDPCYEEFLVELRQLAIALVQKNGQKVDERLSLDQNIYQLYSINKGLPRFLNAISSHPMKLNSGNNLKYHPGLQHVIRVLFGGSPLIASPEMSDAFLMNFPSLTEDNRPLHQALPIHQDFPYMLQSPRQIVVWIPLSERRKDLGGLTLWLKSHKNGIRKQRKIGDYYEVAAEEAELSKEYEELELDWNRGDVVIMDTHLLHKAIPNLTQKEVRVTQIFRYSDLNDDDSLRMLWRSSTYVDRQTTNRKVIEFEEVYDSLLES